MLNNEQAKKILKIMDMYDQPKDEVGWEKQVRMGVKLGYGVDWYLGVIRQLLRKEREGLREKIKKMKHKTNVINYNEMIDDILKEID